MYYGIEPPITLIEQTFTDILLFKYKSVKICSISVICGSMDINVLSQFFHFVKQNLHVHLLYTYPQKDF
jgi:hypothetical protein